MIDFIKLIIGGAFAFVLFMIGMRFLAVIMVEGVFPIIKMIYHNFFEIILIIVIPLIIYHLYHFVIALSYMLDKFRENNEKKENQQ